MSLSFNYVITIVAVLVHQIRLYCKLWKLKTNGYISTLLHLYWIVTARTSQIVLQQNSHCVGVCPTVTHTVHLLQMNCSMICKQKQR